MSVNPFLENHLVKAKVNEDACKWIDAEANYQQAISRYLENEDYLKAGETQEKAAFCLYRAAYQSEQLDEFKKCLGQVSDAFNQGVIIYENLDGPLREVRTQTNKIMANFYRSWIIEDPVEKKNQIGRCVDDFKKVLGAYEAEEESRYGKVINDFLEILYSYAGLSFTQTEGAEIIEDALEHGSSALKALRKEEDVHELARCHYLLSMFLSDMPLAVIESPERQQELLAQGMGYAEKALELSLKTGDPYLIGLSNGALGYYIYEVKGDPKSAKSFAEKQLEFGGQIGDNIVLARAHENLSYYYDTIAYNEEDRDKMREAANAAILHADKAVSHFKTILHPILTPFLARNQCRHHLAIVETELESKRRLELEGLEISLEDLEYAEESGSLHGQMYLYHLLGGSYLSLAKLERDTQEKKKLLQESKRYREKFIDSSLVAQPFFYWNLAAAHSTIADLLGQFAISENNPVTKKEILVEAITEMEKSTEYFTKHFKISDDEVYRDNYALSLTKFGDVLVQMYLTSEDEQHLERAVQLFFDSTETYKKLNKPSYVAWTLWKIAWAYYQTRDYSKSAAEFDGASRYYLRVGEKYPNHREFYADYAEYMEAWGNIARAMDYHSRDEYFLEKEYFEKAAQLLQSSERWRYLSPNYEAWARLAEAESKSRNEQCEKAIGLFQETSNIFLSAKDTIEDKLGFIGEEDEADMAIELKKASDLRIDYCRGRVALEEAKLLDRKGEHGASSRRYGDAAQIYQKIMQAMDSETERREIKPLHSLCLAWRQMTRAEAEASHDLYYDASTLFEEAKEHSPNEKTRLLIMGHANFCRALGAGIQYEVSREENLHQELVRYLGSATDFYVRAGYDSAMEYSRATQRLFEAYQYMDRARRVLEPSEKTRNFTMAERLLRVSAEAFSRARHSEKRDEVARLLRSLNEDREVAASLSEILDAPGIASSTESFRAPTPSHEYPVGLDSFEHADIQGKIFMTSDTITSGEEFHLELELYNPGKTSTTLARVENLFPEDFEVGGISGIYRYEDEVLDLRSKRIGPLSNIEISIRARPLSKGQYALAPKIVFLDDTGEQRTSEPEPVTITVREMGILSWLRGADHRN